MLLLNVNVLLPAPPPTQTLRLPAVIPPPALTPTATLSLPLVIPGNTSVFKSPTATFPLPIMLNPASEPKTLLAMPLTLFWSARAPTPVFKLPLAVPSSRYSEVRHHQRRCYQR